MGREETRSFEAYVASKLAAACKHGSPLNMQIHGNGGVVKGEELLKQIRCAVGARRDKLVMFNVTPRGFCVTSDFTGDTYSVVVVTGSDPKPADSRTVVISC